VARIFGWLTVLWIVLLGFSFFATPAHPAGVTRVFDCSGPDCSRLTAKTNDYLDMGSGTQSQPCVESTSAPTGACAASACVYDTSNSKLYFCGASGWAEIAGGGGGSTAFSAITTGENTGQTLEVGTGSSLKTTGFGLIGANRTFATLKVMDEDKTITAALDFIKWGGLAGKTVTVGSNNAFPTFVSATGTFHYDVEPVLNLGPSFFSFQPIIEIDTTMTITGANAFYANPKFTPLASKTLTLLGTVPTIYSGFLMENSGGGSVASTSDIVQYGTGGSVESGFTLDRVLGYECGAPVAAGTITNRSCFVATAQTTATDTVGFETLGTIDFGLKIADGSSVGVQVNNSAYAIDINDGAIGITIDSTSGTALAINPDAGQIAIDINGGGTGVDIAAGVTTGIVNASKTVYSPGTAVDPGTSAFTVTKTVTEFNPAADRNIILAAGTDGQVTTFVNINSSHVIQFWITGNLAWSVSPSNIRVSATSCQTICANNAILGDYCALGQGDTLTALYLDSLSDWVVVSCSNNG
jgi:hypothetical protein